MSSFSYGAVVSKHNEVRKALDNQREQRTRDLPETFEDSDAGHEQAAAVDAQKRELEVLGDATAKAAETLVKGLEGSSFQITVSGNTDPTGTTSASVAVVAVP